MASMRWMIIGFLLLSLQSSHGLGENDEAHVTVDTDGQTKTVADVLRTVKEKNGALVLNDATFDDVVKSLNTVLVMFYASWCQHSQRVAPEFHAATQRLRAKTPPVYTAIADIDECKNISIKYNISAIPWLKLFKNGKQHNFLGEKTRHDIVRFMEEATKPDWDVPQKIVVPLTLQEFKQRVEDSDPTLIVLHVPNCQMCATLARMLELVGDDLKGKMGPVRLASFDVDHYYDDTLKYKIPGYPGFVVARNGNLTAYRGSSTEEALTKYIMKLTEQEAVLLMSPHDLDKPTNEGNIFVVGFFEDKSDSNFRIFMNVAGELRDQFPFGYCFHGDCLDFGHVDRGSVAIFVAGKVRSEYEAPMPILDEGYSAEDLRTFILENQFPLVGEFTSLNSEVYTTREPLCLVFFEVDWSFDFRTVTMMWHRKIAGVAKDYPNITFVIADEEKFDGHVRLLNLDFSPEEINIGIMGTNATIYTMEPMEEFDTDEIRKFLDNFEQGRLTPKYYSKSLANTPDHVVVVNSSTFQEIVLNQGKDVLIEFYSPTCGACEAFAPTYRKIAYAYKDMKNVIIAKMDAVANGVPANFTVDRYPTVYLVTLENESVLYTGTGTVESMITFMETNSEIVRATRAGIKLEV